MTTPPSKKPRLSLAPASATSDVAQSLLGISIAAEEAVGITEYVNLTLPGFSGVLKHRYSDFLVNEVDLSCSVVHLSSIVSPSGNLTGPPAEKKDERVNVGAQNKQEEQQAFDVDKAREELSKIVPVNTANSIIALNSADKGSGDTVVTPPLTDKNTRSSLHVLIRNAFSGHLLTETTTTDPPAIHVKRATRAAATAERRRSRRGGKRNKNSAWTDLGGEYCHFTLYKENRDTMEVVNLLARLLKLNTGNKAFSFAGTKDRRAITVQRCAVHMVPAERLAGLNTAGFGGLRGARLGDFEYKTHGLSLGDLKGNEFVITLRQAQTNGDVELEEAVRRSVEVVKRTGFANYFGLQRFGSFDVSTAEIGTYLLKGHWRGAVEKILSYDPTLCGDDAEGAASSFSREDRERAQACEIYFTTYDYEKAGAKMPRRYVAESAILRYFKERGIKGDGKGKGLDYLGALQSISRNLRTMYGHAYQSLVWNNVASARLRISRTEVLPGDLVLVEKNKKREVAKEEVDQHGEAVVAPDATDAEEDSFQRARALTSDEVSSGKYSITDVVLPTPGWDIKYPVNEELQKIYKDIMARDGLDPMDMKRTVRDWSLPGSYRKILSRFIDGECGYEVRKCKLGEQVVETDLEKIEAATQKAGEKRKRDGEGEQLAEEMVVVLRMRLGTSCYATMALRELMKGGAEVFKPEFSR